MIADLTEIVTYILVIIILLFITILTLFSVFKAVKKKEIFVSGWFNEFAYLGGNRTNPKKLRILKKDMPVYYYLALLIRTLIGFASVYLAIFLLKQFA